MAAILRPSAEAQRAADTLSYWCHVFGALDLADDYELLLGGLADAKRAYLAALAAHDHVAAGRHLAEVTDLTWICGEMAAGLAAQRGRCLAAGKLWPLARVV